GLERNVPPLLSSSALTGVDLPHQVRHFAPAIGEAFWVATGELVVLANAGARLYRRWRDERRHAYHYCWPSRLNNARLFGRFLKQQVQVPRRLAWIEEGHDYLL
ncbi:MAG: hypothetical protein ABI145_09770, partial [Steroidobacteraceae bacterium]